MKKIIVISHACFTAINRNVYHLFLKDGWHLEIVVPESLQFPSGTKKADPPEKEDPEIHYLKLSGTNPRSYYFEGLIELLNDKKPEIILLDNDPVSVLAGRVGKWCGSHEARLYCISNENLPLDIRSGIARRGWKALPPILFKRSLLSRNKKRVYGIFTVNKDGERIFKEEGFQNVRHMPLGFDPAFFHPDKAAHEKIRLKHKMSGVVVAYFGRLTREKGVHLLIESLQGLQSLEWTLMMDSFDIYASEYNQEIGRLISDAGISDRVVFIRANHFEIADYMNAADIVVVPSISVANWKEQYGRVAAEAMACGKEVIASDSGALPDLLDGHGFLFKEGSVTELRNKLSERINKRAANAVYGKDIADYALSELSIQKQKTVMEAAFQ